MDAENTKCVMRVGDSSEYEDFDSPEEAALSLKDMLENWDRRISRDDIMWRDKGLNIRGLFEDGEYISLYMGDADDSRSLTKQEKGNFVSNLLGESVNARTDHRINKNKRGNWTDDPCFYVSCQDAGRAALLAGPFRTEEECRQYAYTSEDGGLPEKHKALLDAACRRDPKAWFYAYGMVLMKDGYREGVLNKELGL